MFVDSHCHLDRLKLDPYENGLDDAIAAASDAGVSEMLCVAIDLEHIQDVLAISERFENVYASVGVHPNSFEGEAPTRERLLALAEHRKVIAIGETGLDYYYGAETREEQMQRFITHFEVSAETRKPVIVHTRSAKEDTLALIEKHCDQDVAGVLHCFTEDWDMAQRAMEMGFYISLSGIVTFKNAKELQDVARRMPLERLLIETDSPYLAPVPFRGKPNEPKHVAHVAQFIADIREMPLADLASATESNYRDLFNRH